MLGIKSKFILLVISILIILTSSSVSGNVSLANRQNKPYLKTNFQDLIIITPSEPDGENGWYTTEPIISINTALPITEISFRIDDGCWTAYTGPFTQNWSDGYHTFEAKAIHCDCGEIYDFIDFKVDTTPPELFTPDIFQCPFSIKAYALDYTSEMNKFEFYCDWRYKHTDSNEPYTWNPDSDEIRGGIHWIKTIAYDNAGNSKSDEITVWIIQSKIISLKTILQRNIFQFLFSNL
jgi:hypothetical protein